VIFLSFDIIAVLTSASKMSGLGRG